jgi:hypothetical protein
MAPQALLDFRLGKSPWLGGERRVHLSDAKGMNG